MLDFEEYADGIADAAVVLHANAVRAGLDAAVPTCPGWKVRDLLAHTGMVHRWATAIVAGPGTGPEVGNATRISPRDIDTAALELAGHGAKDLVDWVDDGVEDLLRSLDRAPDDLDVWFLLRNAPSPRLGWSRRQCHETIMHGVDALSAALGRPPGSQEVWFGPELAADGLDELLTGFLPRPKTSFRLPAPRRVLVKPEDVDACWTLDLGPDGATTTPGALGGAETVLHGSATQLYLGLWNRGAEVHEEGEPLLVLWAAGHRVTWG